MNKGSGEAALQERWARVRLPRTMRTQTGERIRLLYAGTWNHGPGPDFLRARLLRANGLTLRGEVEVHLRPEDWRRHGHDTDPAYDSVVLHVVESLPAPSANGSPAASSSPQGPRRTIQLLVVDPAPDSHSPGTVAPGTMAAEMVPRRSPPARPTDAAHFPCQAVVARAGAPAVAARLTTLGQRRLLNKAARLQSKTTADDGGAGGVAAAEADQAAYTALLLALTQSGDRSAGQATMHSLAATLPLSALPLMAGAAAVTDRLRRAWRELMRGASPPDQAGARQAGGRPANAPQARLAAAGALLARLSSPPAREGSLPRDQDLAGALARLAALPESEAITALHVPHRLGVAKARQLLVDLCYPLALARTAEAGGGSAQASDRTESPSIAAALIDRWDHLKAARYGRTEPLRRRLEAGGLPIGRNGWSQALLSLEQEYCREGACAICPLARLARAPHSPTPLPSTNL